MSKFRINTDQPIPSEDFIMQNKPSLESIVSNAPMVSNPAKRWWRWGGGSAAAVVATVVTVYMLNPSNPDETTSTTPVVPDTIQCVEAPIPEINIPVQTYSFNNQDGGTFLSETGTRIRVPANSFADSQGKIVTGPVDLTFREFHKVPDFFRAGIPMTYDSAGVEYTFESAGMFELLAFDDDGNPLQVADGKNVFVDLISYDADPKHNVYYLDTIEDNWEYMERSIFRPRDEMDGNVGTPDYTYAYSSPVNNTENIRATLIKPQLSTKGSFLFKAQYDKTQFPELSAYDNVLFQVDESRQTFDPELYKVKWASVTIKKSKMDGLYMLRLERPDTTVKVYASPVFDAAGYQTAMARYNKSTAADQSARAQYNATSQQAVSNRATGNAEFRYLSTPGMNAPGYRTVSVFQVGIHNCDYPRQVVETIRPSFTEDGAPFVPARIYWTDKTINAMFEANGSATEINVNKNTPVVMWVVNGEGQMAIITANEFAKATRKTDNPVFDVHFADAREGLQKLNEELYGKAAAPATSEDIPENAGIAEKTDVRISINCFPNPATSTINIRISGNESFSRSSVNIIASDGRLVQTITPSASDETQSFEISSYPPGIYFVQLRTSDGKSVSQRFIKQ